MRDSRKSAERPVRIPVSELRRLMEDLLKAAGCKARVAAAIADVFLEADLRGHSIQGLDHMFTMLRDLRSGRIDAAATPRIMREKPGSVLVDGRHGPGQIAAKFAVALAVRKARRTGCAAVGITRSSDIFMLGYYAEQIARAGMIGIVFSNAPPRVHPPGGINPVLGTNPLALAIPRGRRDPVVADFATAASASGHVRIAGYTGTRLPPGIAIGPDGRPTRDPAAAIAGALAPLGGHKGFALGLCVGILSGPLVGAAVGAPLAGWLRPTGRAGRKGHFMIAIDPAAFGAVPLFQRSVARHLREVKAVRRAPGVAAIRFPGERGFAARLEQRRNGVRILPEVWARTRSLAESLGVLLPRPR
jgi:LDH2 family malate/lactate/ureidoglycolate dehydrogenase